jgi:hypothetical protein
VLAVRAGHQPRHHGQRPRPPLQPNQLERVPWLPIFTRHGARVVGMGYFNRSGLFSHSHASVVCFLQSGNGEFLCLDRLTSYVWWVVFVMVGAAIGLSFWGAVLAGTLLTCCCFGCCCCCFGRPFSEVRRRPHPPPLPRHPSTFTPRPFEHSPSSFRRFLVFHVS